MYISPIKAEPLIEKLPERHWAGKLGLLVRCPVCGRHTLVMATRYGTEDNLKSVAQKHQEITGFCDRYQEKFLYFPQTETTQVIAVR